MRWAWVLLLLGCVPPEGVRTTFPPEPLGSFEVPGGFSGRGAIAAGEFGEVYIVDTDRNRLVRLDPEGRLLSEAGGFGEEPGRFRGPSDVEVWGLEVLVADEENMRVQRFDRSLNFLGNYDTGGRRPLALAVSDDGVFFVEGGKEEVWQVTQEGVLPFGTGSLGGPVDISAWEGRVWISDAGRDEVVVMDVSGVGLDSWKLEGPLGIGARDGICWVADGRKVWALHYETGPLGSLGGPLEDPIDVAVGRGEVYVLGKTGKVWVFGGR